MCPETDINARVNSFHPIYSSKSFVNSFARTHYVSSELDKVAWLKMCAISFHSFSLFAIQFFRFFKRTVDNRIICFYVYNGYSHSSTACDLTRLFLLISVADNFTAILLLLDIIQQNLIQLEGNLANGHGNIVVYGGRSYKVMTDDSLFIIVV